MKYYRALSKLSPTKMEAVWVATYLPPHHIGSATSHRIYQVNLGISQRNPSAASFSLYAKNFQRFLSNTRRIQLIYRLFIAHCQFKTLHRFIELTCRILDLVRTKQVLRMCYIFSFLLFFFFCLEILVLYAFSSFLKFTY